MPDDPQLRVQFDVVLASEVIEHVASPIAFARTLRTALNDGGSLVVTTPDVEAVGPQTPHGILVPLLSIGYHLVLQSAASLEALLRQTGFIDIDVRRVGGGQLVASCQIPSGTPTPRATPADLDMKKRYRRYLDDAAQAVDRDGDLWFGLIARLYREAVNAADGPAADAAWDAFSAGCLRRFGMDVEAGTEATNAMADDSLESLFAREPLCLGPVLLHRGFHRLHIGKRSAEVENLFRRSAGACRRLRRSLQAIGTDDGDAEDIAWVAGAEELLCMAERGAEHVPERFSALGSSPNDAALRRNCQPLRTDHYRRRAFVSLVNAARLDDADRLADVVAAVEVRSKVPGMVLADDELDVLFCAAAREMQRPEGAADRALDLIRLLGNACDTARAAGRSGSAITLLVPMRDVEILALKALGRSEEPYVPQQAKRAEDTDKTTR